MICDEIINCSTSFEIPRKTLIDKKGGRSKYCIDNPDRKEFFEIDFEECVYKNRNNDTKCDFVIQTKETIYYIELKGSDIKKGVEQLLSTINETEKCYKKHTMKARLIVSKFQKPQLVKQTKEYKDLVKKVNQELIITQNTFTEII